MTRFLEYNPMARALQQYLVELRSRQGMSQRRLAKVVGMSATEINKFESGERDILPEHLARITGGLGIAPVTVMREIAQMMQASVESGNAAYTTIATIAGGKAFTKAPGATGVELLDDRQPASEPSPDAGQTYRPPQKRRND